MVKRRPMRDHGARKRRKVLSYQVGSLRRLRMVRRVSIAAASGMPRKTATDLAIVG